MALQGSSHLLLCHTDGEDVVVLVMAFQTCDAQRLHVIRTKVLKWKVMVGAGPAPQILLRFHQRVSLEGLPLVVLLEMPEAQRHLTLQTGLHRRSLVIYALVTENDIVCLWVRRFDHIQDLFINVLGRVLETLDNVGKFDIFLQGIDAVIGLATLWAA